MQFSFDGQTYEVESIIGSDGIQNLPKINKPIILRSGITKLMDNFDLTEEDHDVKFWNIREPDPDKQELGYCCVVKMHMFDNKLQKRFIGNGEANAKNCKGYANAYPVAMACKRARSRAVIDYLKIDAYGEDESPDFSAPHAPVSSLQGILDAITTLDGESIKTLNERVARSWLSRQIKVAQEKLKMERDDLLGFAAEILEKERDGFDINTCHNLDFAKIMLALEAKL